MPVDIEYTSLVNNVFRTKIPGHFWRAYTIVPAIKNKTTHDVMVSSHQYLLICFNALVCFCVDGALHVLFD